MYLLKGQKEIRPASIVNIRLIDKLSEVDRHLKVIAMKDALSDNEKIYVMEQLRDIKELLDNWGCGRFLGLTNMPIQDVYDSLLDLDN